MKYRNIFIDLDDTLWDIHQNGKVCLKQIYHDYGYNEFYTTFEDYYNVYMPHNVDLWTQYRERKIKKDFILIFFIEGSGIAISTEHETGSPRRCSAHLFTQDVKGHTRVSFDDQFVVDMHDNRAAA